jgi:hypothetical protein
MSSLLKEELKTILSLTNKNNYNYFVETGTYLGETILRFINDFDKLYTIELSEYFYNEFNKNYKGEKIKSILGDSSEMLKSVIDELRGDTIFFLDGHYSSGNTARGTKDCPLLEELSVINSYFKYESIIIIDDLRLFGTKVDQDWLNITTRNLLDSIAERLEFSLELNDRLIIKLRKYEFD